MQVIGHDTQGEHPNGASPLRLMHRDATKQPRHPLAKRAEHDVRLLGTVALQAPEQRIAPLHIERKMVKAPSLIVP